MKTIKIFTLVAMVILAPMSFAGAKAQAVTPIKAYLQDEGWDKLGSRIVNMQAEHDEIPVTVMDGVFTKVRLKIMKAPIHLLNMNIIFGNGDNQNVVFNKKFAPGTYTRIIDLPGNKRIIKKVKLNYKSVPVGKGRAVVTLFGKH
ncbi:hypothetical protein K6119_16145 [Paracrocinitomix mangrovi]|uniref:hypothetical protein n=1 Tax=Paracrocinitomix mangrovi TaxID=2862509 RepID=UPI001C8CFB09|nr:hypothetical protein [Paracrocinitomix mangrovi]UKN01260.1 hypothetical protein K6119_16145 [Paracrocinitomix mangrovi]